MKMITLTDKVSGAKFDVNVDQIKLIEMQAGGTHIVFAADMGRVVAESIPAIYTAIGVLPVIAGQ